MRRLFREFDRDCNGEIDRLELKQIFREMGKFFTDSELQRMITLADKDDSGTIDYEEFIAYFFGKEDDKAKNASSSQDAPTGDTEKVSSKEMNDDQATKDLS